MLKKYFYLFVFLLFTNCGFTPLYNSKNIDYQINIIEITGDNIINSTMVNEMIRISKLSSKKVFNLKINTNYEKKIMSKDLKGSTSDYQLIATVNIQIIENNNIETITYKEKQIIKKNSDNFEQINYENTIKESIANSFVRKLNIELSNK